MKENDLLTIHYPIALSRFSTSRDFTTKTFRLPARRRFGLLIIVFEVFEIPINYIYYLAKNISNLVSMLGRMGLFCLILEILTFHCINNVVSGNLSLNDKVNFLTLLIIISAIRVIILSFENLFTSYFVSYWKISRSDDGWIAICNDKVKCCILAIITLGLCYNNNMMREMIRTSI